MSFCFSWLLILLSDYFPLSMSLTTAKRCLTVYKNTIETICLLALQEYSTGTEWKPATPWT